MKASLFRSHCLKQNELSTFTWVIVFANYDTSDISYLETVFLKKD